MWGERMVRKETLLLNRRRVLYAALMGGGGAALSACAPAGDPTAETDIWAGFDDRITERSLAEAEKLFGLNFTTEERRLILGGPVEEDEDGVFATQVRNLESMRSFQMPNSFTPAMTFDPRLPGVAYAEQANSVTLFPEEIASLPDNAEDIAFASVKQQARWMTTGQIPSLELTVFFYPAEIDFGEFPTGDLAGPGL